jgi:predicted nucleic acid-binding protein
MVGRPRYVDINIFVYWLGKHPEFGEAAYDWVKKIEGSPRGEFVTSSLTLYETLVIIAGLTGKSLKNKGFVEAVVKSVTRIRGLVVEPLKSEDFANAVDLMGECGLDFEDSVHLAVALRVGAQEIVSNDRDFDVAPIKRIM